MEGARLRARSLVEELTSAWLAGDHDTVSAACTARRALVDARDVDEAASGPTDASAVLRRVLGAAAAPVEVTAVDPERRRHPVRRRDAVRRHPAAFLTSVLSLRDGKIAAGAPTPISRGHDAARSLRLVSTPAPRPLDGRRALVHRVLPQPRSEIARSLARRGATVVVTYHRSQEEAEAVVEDLRRATGLPHRAIPADLSDPDAAGAMVEAARDALGGPVEILVNNHGPFSMTPFHQMPADEFAHVMDGNLTLTLRAVQQVVPGMRSGGWRRIVNLSAGSDDRQNDWCTAWRRAPSYHAHRVARPRTRTGDHRERKVAPGQIIESAADIGDIDPTFVDRAVAPHPAGRLVADETAEVVPSLCAPRSTC